MCLLSNWSQLSPQSFDLFKRPDLSAVSEPPRRSPKGTFSADIGKWLPLACSQEAAAALISCQALSYQGIAAGVIGPTFAWFSSKAARRGFLAP